MDSCNFQDCFISRLNMLKGEQSVLAFAGRLDEKQQSVDKYLKGETKAPISFLVNVATRFNVTTDWLLGLHGDGNVSSVSTLETRNGIRQKITTLKDNADTVATKAKELISAISELEKDL